MQILHEKVPEHPLLSDASGFQFRGASWSNKHFCRTLRSSHMKQISADRKRGQRKRATSKKSKSFKNAFRHFSTFFAQGRNRQKVSNIFSTIFAQHQFSGPFWGALKVSFTARLWELGRTTREASVLVVLNERCSGLHPQETTSSLSFNLRCPCSSRQQRLQDATNASHGLSSLKEMTLRWTRLC